MTVFNRSKVGIGLKLKQNGFADIKETGFKNDIIISDSENFHCDFREHERHKKVKSF